MHDFTVNKYSYEVIKYHICIALNPNLLSTCTAQTIYLIKNFNKLGA